MKKINAAFVGFRHGHAFGMYEKLGGNESINIIGAFEENDEARKAAEERGVGFNLRSLEAVFADPAVELVVIGDCYGKRGSLAVKALEAGKSVFTDKPLCTSCEEAEKIRELAEKNGLVVGMMLDMRCSPNIAIACKAVRDGLVGVVNNIIFEAQHPLNYGKRPGWYFEEGMHGGTINDIAVHGIDVIRLLTGCGVKRTVAARVWNHYAQECPGFKDSAQVMLELDSGAGVIGDVSYAAPSAYGYSHPSYWHFRVFGKKGMLDFSLGSDGVTLYPAEGEKIIRLTECGSTYDYAQDLIRALTEPDYGRKYTDEILTVTEQTLLIQAAANKEGE